MNNDETMDRAKRTAHGVLFARLDDHVPAAGDFLAARRTLMAAKLRAYFERLGELGAIV